MCACNSTAAGVNLVKRPGNTPRNPWATANELPSSIQISEKYPATLPFAPVSTRVVASRQRSVNISFMNRQNAGCASRFQNGLYRRVHPSCALSVRNTSEMYSIRCAPSVTMNAQKRLDAQTTRSRRTRRVLRATASSVVLARAPPKSVRAR
jgi:hypothetical protein